MTQRDLLIELQTEELPARLLTAVSQAWHTALLHTLQHARVAYAGQPVCYATPRRIASWIPQVADTPTPYHQTLRGPSVAAGDQHATAVVRFAQRHGVTPHDLTQAELKGGRYWVLHQTQATQPTQALLPDWVQQTLAGLSHAKAMHWGAGVRFPRPIRGILLQWGSDTLQPESSQAWGIPWAAHSTGHRVHHPEPVPIASPQAYVDALRAAHVIVDRAERQRTIQQQIDHIAQQHQAQAVCTPALLDEITDLVEWPVALCGTMDPAFLSMPQEVILAVFTHHQRYVALRDPHTQALLPRFITVANLASHTPQSIVEGNEKVLAARLTDALYFWDQDTTVPLTDHLPALHGIVFHRKLGHMGDHTQRVVQMATYFSDLLQRKDHTLQQAARTLHCDLNTMMVSEFPELKGIMGSHCTHDGPQVALALREGVLPRLSSDPLPTSEAGMAVALSDKLITLVSLYPLSRPSGTHDPFGLRRTAQGIARLLDVSGWPVHLRTLLEVACRCMPETLQAHCQVEDMVSFCLERYKSWWSAQGHHPACLQAAWQSAPSLSACTLRAQALEQLLQAPHAAAFLQLAKRLRNLALQHAATGPIESQYLTHPLEQRASHTVSSTHSQLDQQLDTQHIDQALSLLWSHADHLNAWLDHVRIHDPSAPEASLQRRRLVCQWHRCFDKVADFALLSAD